MSQITEGTFVHGSLASIGASALQLSADTTPLKRGVVVKAAPSTVNGSGIVYVGKSTVTAGFAAPTTDGFPLAAGESITIEVDRVSRLYCIGSTTGLAVSFMGS